MSDERRGDLPRIHPRETIVRAAAVKLAEAVEDLTPAETVAVLAAHLSRVAKFEIRVERHGDASKPGGIQ